MPQIQQRKSATPTENSGIDFDCYDDRARQLRAATLRDWFRGLAYRNSAHTRLPADGAAPGACG